MISRRAPLRFHRALELYFPCAAVAVLIVGVNLMSDASTAFANEPSIESVPLMAPVLSVKT